MSTVQHFSDDAIISGRSTAEQTAPVNFSYDESSIALK